RKNDIFKVIDAIQKETLQTVPGVRRFQIKEMGSDVMATSAAPIHVNIYGQDLAVLDKLGDQVLKVGEKMPELFQPSRTWAMGVPDYRI
ncbi:hypothetical protein ABTM86_19470, partial [Acinetobacter baumannii]